MNKYKTKEIKEKTIVNIEELVGKVTDNKQLVGKGKVRKGLGKAYGVVADYKDQVEGVKDTVVGTAKEKYGELTDDKSMEVKGQIQQVAVKDSTIKRLLYALGAVVFIVFLLSLLTDSEE